MHIHRPRGLGLWGCTSPAPYWNGMELYIGLDETRNSVIANRSRSASYHSRPVEIIVDIWIDFVRYALVFEIETVKPFIVPEWSSTAKLTGGQQVNRCPCCWVASLTDMCWQVNNVSLWSVSNTSLSKPCSLLASPSASRWSNLSPSK